MNKYLDKIAAFSLGRSVTKAIDFGEKVVGSRAKRLRNEAEVLSRHVSAGRTPRQLQRMAEEATKQTRDARIKAGIGAAAVGTAGFLGLHRYHQHKDRAIMQRLNTMYKGPEADNANNGTK